MVIFSLKFSKKIQPHRIVEGRDDTERYTTLQRVNASRPYQTSNSLQTPFGSGIKALVHRIKPV